MLFARTYPLRLVIILPFSLLLVAAATVFCIVSYNNSHAQALSMGHNFAHELSQRIEQYVKHLTEVMPAITEVNSLELNNGNLSHLAPEQNTPWLLGQLRQHLQLSFVSIAYLDGRYIAAARPPNHPEQFEIASNIFNPQHSLMGYLPDHQQHIGRKTDEIMGSYDPRQRPFMRCALADPTQPCWGNVYRYLDSDKYGISLSRAVLNAQNQVIAVTAADIALNRLNQFMAKLNIGYQGLAFLTEPNGQLIASSDTQKIAVVDAAGERYRLDNHPTALVKGLAELKPSRKHDGEEQLRFDSDGQQYLLEVRPIQLGHGLSWQLILLVPMDNIAAPMKQQLRDSLIVTAVLLLMLIVIGVVLARKIVGPVERIARLASRNDLKQLANYQVNNSRFVEVGYLENGLTMLAKAQLNSIYMLEQQVHSRTLALQEANKRLTLLSEQDALTGVANRRAFTEKLDEYWQQALDGQQRISVILCDIDYFKSYNDVYGHQAGDRALTAVAQHMQSHVPTNGLLARYGGEEFAIILPKMAAEQVVSLAEHIRQTLFDKAMARSDISRGVITISLGCATMTPGNSDSAAALVKAADEQLYKAKANGRNQVQAGE